MRREVPFPLSNDPVKKIVRVGEAEFTTPDLRRMREYECHIKREVCGEPPSWSVPDYMRWYCERLGPRFNYRYQAAHYHTWISPHMRPETANLLRHVGRHWQFYNDALVERAHGVLPYVQEAERDGLIHLIPTIVTFQKSPQEIRRIIGKGAWKRAANMSKTRAMKIMQAVSGVRSDLIADRFMHAMEMPSGLILAAVSWDNVELAAARLAPRKRIPEFRQTYHMVRDTKRMMGDDFNPAWSFKRMREEHEKATREQNRKKYSAEPFVEPWSFEADGYRAELLTSPLDIATEGATQHHCVASYAGVAKSGRYAVFAITGKERATLGAHVNRGNAWIEQCYGACNSSVTDKAREFAGKALIEYRRTVLKSKVLNRSDAA